MNSAHHSRFVNPRDNRIRSLNDALRTSLTGGRVMFTQGGRGAWAGSPAANHPGVEPL